MGTRSETVFKDGDGREVCRFYRQMDGYPSGHGVDLAKLCDMTVVNGIGTGMQPGTHANGMGCLAAQVVAKLKEEHGLGGIYMEPTSGPYNEWVDFVYIVRGQDLPGKKPVIECRRANGDEVFAAMSPQEALVAYAKED